MKKLLIALLLVTLFTCSAALAEDLGVQVIGGPNVSALSMSLDDMQLEKIYTIDGYARVAPMEYQVVDYFGQFSKDADYNAVDDSYRDGNRVYYQEKALKGEYSYYHKQASWQESGLNAEFIWLKMDVTNLQKSSVNYLDEITVKVVYAEEYEFAGWVRQINYDHNTVCYRYGSGTHGGGTVVMHPDNEEPIDMMYTGTYVFGCTLPNSVFADKEPLRIEIKLGNNDLTYHIRK